MQYEISKWIIDFILNIQINSVSCLFPATPGERIEMPKIFNYDVVLISMQNYHGSLIKTVNSSLIYDNITAFMLSRVC